MGWRLLKQDGRCSIGCGPSKDLFPHSCAAFWWWRRMAGCWRSRSEACPGCSLSAGSLAGCSRCQCSHCRDPSITEHRDPSLSTSFSELSAPCSGRNMAFSSSAIHGLCPCVLVPQRSRVPSGRGLKRSPPPGSLACSSAWASRGSGQGTLSPSASKSLSSCR